MWKMYANPVFLICLKCLRHAFNIIGLVILFPTFSFAQASYLRLETMMDTDARRLAARVPGQAAVRWETIAAHPSLPGDRARIALAALLYGRMLFAHEETRVELFARVERAAKILAEGGATFTVETWDLQAGGMSFPIWPWRLVGPDKLTNAKTYVVTLIGSQNGEFFGILLDMAVGLERVLAPASVLVTLSAVSQELDRNGSYTSWPGSACDEWVLRDATGHLAARVRGSRVSCRAATSSCWGIPPRRARAHRQ